MLESFWLSMKKPNLERQVVPVDNSSNCVTTSHNVSVTEVFFYFSSFWPFFCRNQTYPQQSQRAGRIRRTLRIPPSTPLPGSSPTSRSECSGHRSYYMYTIHVRQNPIKFLAKPGHRPGTCLTRRCWPPRNLRARDLLGSGKQTRTLQVPSRNY